MRVLAVDDDPQTRRYVHDALSRAGFSPIVTGDPEDVPRLMEEDGPHLVLLDMMLPGTHGIDLMSDVRAAADVPVIFLSAYGEDDAIARAFDMGAADYRGQALLRNGAYGKNQGSPSPGNCARMDSPAQSLSRGRPEHRLRGTQGDGVRSSGAAHRHRVRRAPPALDGLPGEW